MEEEKVLEEVKPEEVEDVVEDVTTEIEVEGGDDENVEVKPLTHEEGENVEIGDTNIQEG